MNEHPIPSETEAPTRGVDDVMRDYGDLLANFSSDNTFEQNQEAETALRAFVEHWVRLAYAQARAAASHAEPTRTPDTERRGVYIASRTRHAERWIALRAEGYPVSCSWIDEAGAGATADWQDLWDRCIAEASNAASVIVYATDDDKYLKGALVEVGAALGHDVPVYLVMGDRNIAGSAWNHRLVTECDSLDDALALALTHTLTAARASTPETAR